MKKSNSIDVTVTLPDGRTATWSIEIDGDPECCSLLDPEEMARFCCREIARSTEIDERETVLQ